MTTHDIAIVGAGMVGAALALALAREGFDVAVIEPRAPAPWRDEDEVDLRVVALAPSSIDLFGRLDVWTSIASARACAYRRMYVWDALAPGELNFDAADSGESALGWIVCEMLPSKYAPLTLSTSYQTASFGLSGTLKATLPTQIDSEIDLANAGDWPAIQRRRAAVPWWKRRARY